MRRSFSGSPDPEDGCRTSSMGRGTVTRWRSGGSDHGHGYGYSCVDDDYGVYADSIDAYADGDDGGGGQQEHTSTSTMPSVFNSMRPNSTVSGSEPL